MTWLTIATWAALHWLAGDGLPLLHVHVLPSSHAPARHWSEAYRDDHCAHCPECCVRELPCEGGQP